MEVQDQFYITLPSSASLNLYPYNTIADFRTELLSSINLEREMFEVGLSEILLDTDIENVPGNEIVFVIYRSKEFVKSVLKTKVPRGLVGVGGEWYYQEVFYTKRGLYRSLSELITDFNVKFLQSRICKDLIFNVTKVKDSFAELLELKSTLKTEFGNLKTFHIQPYSWFQKGILATNNNPVAEDVHESAVKNHLKFFRRYVPQYNEYLKDFTKSIYFVMDSSKLLRTPGMAYIYTDIIEHQFLGNSKTPVLRVVHFPIDSKVISFTHVHYLSLKKSCINSIRIYTLDIEGRPFAFTDGTITYKLHVRKKTI